MYKKLLCTVISLLMVLSLTVSSLSVAAVTDEAGTGETEAQLPVMDAPAFAYTVDGIKISWAAYEAAASYQLFLHDGSDWTVLAQTDQLTYIHPLLTDGTVYRYNIRALDAAGAYLTDYDAEGFANPFFAPPVITSIVYTADGVSLRWSAADNAERFRVYRKTSGKSWSAIGETETAEYLDTTAVKGGTYSYTVRCISADSSRYTSFYNEGKSILCAIMPEITAFENTAAGTKITYTKPDGAEKIRLYVKNGNSWKKLTETSATTYTHNSLTPGKKYTYTVRSLKNGRFVSDYDHDGWSNTFIEPPVITSLSAVEDGVKIVWKKPSGGVKFRVYGNEGSGWKRLGETTANTYTAKNLTSGRKYTFTIRCINPMDGSFASAYNSGKSIRYYGIPKITSFSNTASGTKIAWAQSASGVRTRVYVKKENQWSRIGETSGSSFVHDKLKAGQTYTYTIRLLDNNGKFLTGYNKTGWKNTFIEPPVISELLGTDDGVNITWKKSSGAVNFRVYQKKDAKSWKKLGETTGNTYLAKDLTSGNTYTFTVRCITSDGSGFTSYYNSGKSIKYLAPPKVTAFENTATGIRVTWSKMSGAAKFRLYYKNGQSWTKVTEIESNSAVHDKLTDGTAYTYTVRALDSKGNFLTDYNRTGWTFTFIAPPVISSVTAADQGNLIAWQSAAGAAAYRLYRKPFSGSWSKLTDTADTSYTDTTAEKGMPYAYTLRCLDDKGATVSGYIDDNVYYVDGALASGSYRINGKDYYFNKGKLRSGFQKIDGKTYYYDASGNIVKNAIVGTAADGYYYAGKTGAIDYGYCNGITYKDTKWNVINGKATKVSSESSKTLHKALKVIAKVTDSSMTKEQKLRACFNHLKKSYGERNPRVPHIHPDGWETLYANDIFDKGYGNCFSYGAAFAFLARGIGYTEVYACNSGGHGWAEVNGKVYDPEWSMHHSEYSYFGMSYTEPCDVKYRSGIAAGYSWMHVKIK